MLVYTPDAKKAVSFLMREFNDVDVYVEDTKNGVEKIYRALFGRALGGEVLISNVYGLGGKAEVLNRFEKDNNPFSRKRIYVVDGDLDLLAGSALRRKKGLFVLGRYSIESYLLDEKALAKILDTDMPTDVRDVLKKINLCDWKRKNCQILKMLFIEYACAWILDKGCETVGYNAFRLKDEFDGYDSALVQQRIDNIREKLIELSGEHEYRKVHREVRMSMMISSCGLKKYVCVKRYVFPVLMARIARVCNGIQKFSLYHRLAMSADLGDLVDLKSHLMP